MIEEIHHVQIAIPRGMEEEARQFYCEVLRLPEIEKPESLRGRGGFWVQVGGRQLHIGTEEGVERGKTKAHVAYLVDDIEAWRERLQTMGVMVEESIPIPGYERFEFRDPFGNRVEMIGVTG
jgi:catechol 2,3-dioxygenase-like lactoylglutathione lyase family enzyme